MLMSNDFKETKIRELFFPFAISLHSHLPTAFISKQNLIQDFQNQTELPSLRRFEPGRFHHGSRNTEQGRGKGRKREEGDKEKGGRCHRRAGNGPSMPPKGRKGLYNSMSPNRAFNQEREQERGEGGYQRVGMAVERLLQRS